MSLKLKPPKPKTPEIESQPAPSADLIEKKPSPQKNSFGKQLRLLNSAAFQRIFDQNPLRISHSYFLLLAKENSLQHPRLGLVIAKKHLRFAVDRNRIKRLTRESFRCHQEQLPGLDIILLSRKGLENLSNKDFLQDLTQQWVRLLKKYRHDQLRSQALTTEADNKTSNNPKGTP